MFREPQYNIKNIIENSFGRVRRTAVITQDRTIPILLLKPRKMIKAGTIEPTKSKYGKHDTTITKRAVIMCCLKKTVDSPSIICSRCNLVKRAELRVDNASNL